MIHQVAVSSIIGFAFFTVDRIATRSRLDGSSRGNLLQVVKSV